MSAISDHIQLEKSKETKYPPLFNKREWLYINDTTTQYDQGTSIIETTALSNNDKFLDYNAGYLTVPILITITARSDTETGLGNPLAAINALPYTKSLGFKKSFYLCVIQLLSI